MWRRKTTTTRLFFQIMPYNVIRINKSKKYPGTFYGTQKQNITGVLQSVCDAFERKKSGNNINPGLESLSAETSEQ